MRVASLIIVCLFQYLSLLAQPPDPKRYNSYKFDRYIYSEEFNNPAVTNWFDEDSTLSDIDSTLSGMIEGGCLYCSIRKGVRAAPIDLNIDDTRDFQIEFRAKIDKKSKRGSHGILTWGRTDTSLTGNYWYFYRDGKGQVFNCTEVDASCKTKYKVEAQVNKHEFNKYTVRKVGSTYYFFVNQQLVFEWPFTPLYGPLLGLGAGSYSKKPVTIAYDYLRVGYLE